MFLNDHIWRHFSTDLQVEWICCFFSSWSIHLLQGWPGGQAAGWVTKHKVDVVSHYLLHWHHFVQSFAGVISMARDKDGKMVVAVVFS